MEARIIERQDATVKFEIEYSAEEVEGALINAYKATKNEFRIDGFRKGKAPRRLIMQRYGEHVFDADAIEGLLQKDYPASLIELDIEPVDKPAVDIPKLKHGEGLIVTLEVQTPPEFEVMGYEGVRVKNVSYPVTDEDVDRQLEKAQGKGTRLVAVERGAQDGDMVNIDYSGSAGGETFAGGTDTGHNLKLGSGAFIEGFEEQLIGSKAGDELDVTVQFPEDYHAEQLAGKEAVFAVKVNEVRMEEKPELDDDFAQDVSEFDTLEELKDDIRAKLEEQAALRAEAELKDAILEKIYEANEVGVPDVMVEDELDGMLKEFEQNIRKQGFKMEQYFSMMGVAPSEMRERIRENAYKRVKMRLIVRNIARMQGFTASEEETEAELDKIAGEYGIDRDRAVEVLGEFSLKLLREDIINKKAVEYIYENAITEEYDEYEDDDEEDNDNGYDGEDDDEEDEE